MTKRLNDMDHWQNIANERAGMPRVDNNGEPVTDKHTFNYDDHGRLVSITQPEADE